MAWMVLLLAVSGLAATPAQAVGTGGIAGTVTRTDGGKLVDIDVTIHGFGTYGWQAIQTVRTGADGNDESE